MKKDNKKVTIELDIKNLIFILVAIVAIVLIFVFSNMVGDRSKDKNGASGNQQNQSGNTQEEANPLLEEGQVLDPSKMLDEVPQIDFAGFKKALADKKTVTVVMLGYDGCYWCRQEKEILRAYLYENTKANIKYLDISKLSNDDFSELQSLDSNLESFGTPTFIAVKGGKVTKVDTQGARGNKGLDQMLKNMGAM